MRRTIALFIVAVLASGLPDRNCCLAADALPTKAEIISELTSWRESFSTIKVVIYQSNRAHVLEAFPELPADAELRGNYYTSYEFLWSDEGLMRYELRLFQKGRLTYREVNGFGTGVSWDARTKRGVPDQEQFELAKISNPHPHHPLQGLAVISGLLPLWDSTGLWVNDALQEPGFSVVGNAEYDGVDCVQVELSGATRKIKLLLDPQRRYLPRCYEAGFYNPQTGKWSSPLVWEADSLEELEPDFWFPTQGRQYREEAYPYPGFEWTVENVVLNSPMPKSLFEPLRQPGLRVIDYTSGETYALDANGHRIRRAAKPVTSTATQSPTDLTAPAVLAVPQTQNWFVIGILASAACFIIALVLRNHQGRHSNSHGRANQ